MTNPMLAELCESVAQSLDNGQKAVAVLSTMLKTVGLVQGYAVADEILGDLKYAAQALPAITRRTHHATLADMAKRLEAAERAVWVLARCRGNQKIPMRVLAEFKRHEAVIEEYRDAEGDYHIVARVKGDPAIDATQEGAG